MDRHSIQYAATIALEPYKDLNDTFQQCYSWW